jgi:hypothetical protein
MNGCYIYFMIDWWAGLLLGLNRFLMMENWAEWVYDGYEGA